jgi:hypothetical protein
LHRKCPEILADFPARRCRWENEWIETATENFDIAFELYENKYGPRQQGLPLPKRIKVHEADYDAWNHQFSSSDADVKQAASNEVKHYFGSPRHKGGDAMTF